MPVYIDAGRNAGWIAELEARKGRLLKHGDHDQKSHGNWAHGGSEDGDTTGSTGSSFVDHGAMGSGGVVAATPGSEPILAKLHSGVRPEMVSLLGGVNGKTKVTLGGETVVSCPVEQVDGGRGAGCELAAGFANEALGGMVDMPGSVVTVDPDSDETLLLTEWREGTPVAATGHYEDWLTASPDAEAETLKLAVFDYITGNVDRHFNNLLVDEATGHLISIDHSLTFGTSIDWEQGDPADEPQWNNTKVLDAAAGQWIPPDVKDSIRGFIEDTAAHQKMADALDLGPGDGAARVEAAVDRARELVNGGEIPHVEAPDPYGFDEETDYEEADYEEVTPTETPTVWESWKPLPADVAQWPKDADWPEDQWPREPKPVSEPTPVPAPVPGQQAIWTLAQDATLVDELRREQQAAVASQFGY